MKEELLNSNEKENKLDIIKKNFSFQNIPDFEVISVEGCMSSGNVNPRI